MVAKRRKTTVELEAAEVETEVSKRKKPEYNSPRYSVKRTLNRDPETINMSGLKPFTAPDTSGDTVVLTAKVDPVDKDFLSELPEGVSFHVRQAVRAYVAGLKKAQAKAVRTK